MMRTTIIAVLMTVVTAIGCGAPEPQMTIYLPGYMQQGLIPADLTATLKATKTKNQLVIVDEEPLTVDTTAKTLSGSFVVPQSTYDITITLTITEPFARATARSVDITAGQDTEIDWSKISFVPLFVDSDSDGIIDLQEMQAGTDPSTHPCPSSCTSEQATVNGSAVKIDKYEASVWSEANCSGVQYGAVDDDYPNGFPYDVQSVDGTTVPGSSPTVPLYACSVAGVLPSRLITWQQARRACENSGKRLCSAAEWQGACQGASACGYPINSINCNVAAEDTCNWGRGSSGIAAVSTGARTSCVSPDGAFDMSGNLAELVEDPTDPGLAFPDAQLRGDSFATSGGGYRRCSEVDGMPRTQGEFHVGFRCCQD